MISDCSRKRRSLGCTSSGRSPISSETACRAADQPRLVSGPVNAPRRCRRAGCRRGRGGGRSCMEKHRLGGANPHGRLRRNRCSATRRDQDGEFVTLEPLNLLDHTRHCCWQTGIRAAAVRRSIDLGASGESDRSWAAHGATLAGHGQDHPQTARTHYRTGCCNDPKSRSVHHDQCLH